MQSHVITSIDQITPEWLTAILHRSGGALTSGAVAAFDVSAGRGNWSTSGTLQMRYSADAAGEQPERLFLKMVNTDLDDDEFFGPSEVHYYTRDYLDVPDAPLLRCYDGQYSSALQRYHLLLDDVSSTHVTALDKEPTLEYGLVLAEGLATLHARWWGEQALAEAGAPIHDAAHIRRFVAVAEPGVDNIVEYFPDQLKPHWPELMQALFTRHLQALIVRAQDLDGFALIHGDANCTNIMVPREGHRPVYIIDRQPFDWSLTTWLGVYDLAYALVVDLPIELRRRWEIQILEHYHARLIERGVRGYSWERLFDDYRLCASMGVYIATEWCRGGPHLSMAHIWMPMLQRSLTACDDLECSALWPD
ncbi:MAG: hypothetical protein KDI55_25055 [Anaerolineae bacterium]|nr:hypothetical protein [Anaerolineae bacterium]